MPSEQLLPNLWKMRCKISSSCVMVGRPKSLPPLRISPMTQPTLQTSTAEEYVLAPRNTSGARYVAVTRWGPGVIAAATVVPTVISDASNRSPASPGTRRADPKSATFNTLVESQARYRALHARWSSLDTRARSQCHAANHPLRGGPGSVPTPRWHYRCSLTRYVA